MFNLYRSLYLFFFKINNMSKLKKFRIWIIATLLILIVTILMLNQIESELMLFIYSIQQAIILMYCAGLAVFKYLDWKHQEPSTKN